MRRTRPSFAGGKRKGEKKQKIELNKKKKNSHFLLLLLLPYGIPHTHTQISSQEGASQLGHHHAKMSHLGS
jgi:hypothetical protein